MRDGIQGSQHVEALPPTGGAHQHTCETPEKAQVRPQHKMGRIHKKDRSLARFGLLQPRLEFVFLQLACSSTSHLAGTADVFKRLRPNFLRKMPTCVGLRLRPVSSSMRLTAWGIVV